MKKTLIVTLLGLSIAAGAPLAQAKGCLRGAAVGGVAGHVAHHHGLLGATAGCIIGHHRANKQERLAQRQQQQQAAAQRY